MKQIDPKLRAILRLADADGATQQLAMEVIERPRAQRDGLIRRLRDLYCAGIVGSGQSRETAVQMGDMLEARLRDQVVEIEVHGGGTVGTA